MTSSMVGRCCHCCQVQLRPELSVTARDAPPGMPTPSLTSDNTHLSIVSQAGRAGDLTDRAATAVAGVPAGWKRARLDAGL